MHRGHAAVWGLGLVALIGAFQWSAADRGAHGLAWLGVFTAAWALTAALAGLHRPAGSDSGMEAMAVPLAIASLGLARGSLVVALGTFLGSLVFHARNRTWQPSPAAGRAGRVALAALAGGGLWNLFGSGTRAWGASLGAWGAAGVVYLLVTLAGSWAFAALAEGDRRATPWVAAESLRTLAPEAVAWVLGSTLVASIAPPETTAFRSWGVVVVAALAIAGAWAEAGRQAHDRALWRARALAASRAATGDPVTGLDRGEALRSRLELEIERSRRDGLPMTLALFDLDGLRRTNAERGVTSGDERLRLLAIRSGGIGASRVSGASGDSAYAARWHGGGIGWILPRVAGRDALAMIEIVRREAELDANPTSCGLVAIPEVAARDADDLLAMADAALVIAKRLGRSRALLDLGAGWFMDGEGRSVDTRLDEDSAPSNPPPMPTFFA